jgi:phosphoribosylglycinamide formyltransferase 1
MTSPTRKRVGILISGRGSNMMALADAMRDPRYPAEIALVISNRPDAAGLAWAQAQGFATASIDHTLDLRREDFEAKLQAALLAHRCDLVACCGFMRLMTPGFVTAWHNRMVNIHPALLPSYKGLHTHERALADGVRIVGATVHVVRPQMDAGPIIAQVAVPVEEGDTAQSLGARVLCAEHVLYPHALALFASGAARVEGDVIRLVSPHDPASPAMLISPARSLSHVPTARPGD